MACVHYYIVSNVVHYYVITCIGKDEDYRDDNASYMDCIMRFAATFPDCLILVEFGGTAHFSKETQHVVTDVFALRADGVHFAVSLPSGRERSLSCPTDLSPFKKFTLNCIELSRVKVKFVPFKEEEAFTLMSGGKYPLSRDFYSRLTNYNPRLLSLCAGCGEDAAAEHSVLQEVRKCANEIVQCMDADKNAYIQVEVEVCLQSTIHMIYCAYNNCQLGVFFW